VFLEDNLSDKILPDFILKRRFSGKSFYRDFYEHQHALNIFKSFTGEYQLPRYQSLTYQKSTILLGFDKTESELEADIKNYLTTLGYFVWDNVEEENEDLIVEGKRHFYLSNTHLSVCLTDKLTSKGCYYLGALRSIQIPAILLTQAKNSSPKGWVPAEFQLRPIPKENHDNAFSIIKSQIELFEEDFVVVDNEQKWESYIHSLSSKPMNDGEYSHELRDQIINNIYMGDKFENISGNVSKNNSGNLVQGRDIKIDGSFIQDKFGKDASDALVKVAEIVNASNNKDGKELFESMAEELKKEKPKKSILSSLWSGITTAVPLIKSSTEIFEKVSAMIHNIG